MSKKRILALIVAATLALSLVGCAPAKPAGGGGDKPPVAAVKDTLTYSISSDVDNFDPFTNQTLTFIKSLGYNCYESLLHIGESMEYVPDLATSWDHPDDLTYIFHLREGVKFHNGKPMTAEDVKFSFDYVKQESVASWLATFFASVSAVTVKDAKTVEVKLSKVSNTFLDDVAMLKIVNKGTESTLKQQPVGTGAFKFVKWTPNDKIELEKFAEYWDASNVKLKKLVFQPLPDKKIQLTNLKSGGVNLVEDLPLSEVDAIKADKNLQIIQSKSSNSIVLFEVARHNVPAFADVKVMEAMGMAFDAKKINDVVYKGLGKVDYSPYPTGAKFYKSYDQKFDLAKAKEILGGTKFKDGFAFDLCIATGFPEWEKVAVLYQADLKTIGVTMNIKKVDFSEWLDNYLNRTYDMIINQYPMAGTDPAVYNNIILTQLEPFQLKDVPEIAELIVKGAAVADPTERKAIYEKIQDIVVKYRPVMTINEAPLIYGATAGLKGVSINPAGHTFLKGAYFA